MKKIFINKNDDPALIVEKILEEQDRDLVLVIPKLAKLSSSVANFHLIKREADAGEKNILIESIDDDALALGKAAKLAGINPFLSGRRKGMSDIVAPSGVNEEDTEDDTDEEDEEVEEMKEDEELEDTEEEVDFTKKDIEKKRQFKLPTASFKLGKLKGLAAATAVIIPVFIFAASTTAPRVTLDIDVEEYDFAYNDPVEARSSVVSVDSDNNIIASEVFTERKNITLQFPASGEKEVERRATGTATIYNAFSTKSQPLVATTRLLTPDGKLFRLVERITVPGADIEDGEIIPSSIDAKIIADKPGEKYNVGPVSRFSIPGFQGSSKYKGFYGDSKGSMSGGLIGITAFPTEEDEDSAKATMEETLRKNLEAFTQNGIPEGFISISDSSEFSILKIEVDEAVNDEDKFSVFGEAELKTIAFPKSQLTELINNSASQSIGFGVNIKEDSLSFDDIEADFEGGTISFITDWKGVASRDIDKEGIKEDVKGKNSAELKDVIVSIDGVASAKISFWPFWVKKSPDNTSKIEVNTNR